MLADHLDNWDNNAPDGDDSPDYRGPTTPASLYDCAEHCAQSPACMQYRLDTDGRCMISPWALRGLPAPGVQSGTMLWRVDAAIEEKGLCPRPNWITK